MSEHTIDKRSRAYVEARYWFTDKVRDCGIERMRAKLDDMLFSVSSPVEVQALRDVIEEYDHE